MKKDWTGDGNSVFKTLGASSHTDEERQVDDFYATDPIAIDKLAEVFDLPKKVWEPACGAGHLSKRLADYGCEVVSTDLVDRGFGKSGVDFLATDSLPEGVECIVTNPPFKFATEFVEHALDLLPVGAPAIFLLRTLTLEGKGRFERLYSHGWLHCLYQFSERVLCAKNGDFDYMGGAVAYGWFVFRKTPAENCIIKWV